MKNVRTRHGNIKCKYCKYKKRNEMYCNRTGQRIHPDVIGCNKGQRQVSSIY